MKKYNIQVISAGAGSGKTYRLTQELSTILKGEGEERIRAQGIIGTTFTRAAASELKERVRASLIEGGLSQEANELLVSNIGTVNSVCSQILKNFCYEAGLPPHIQVLDEDQQKVVFSEAIGQVIPPKVDQRMLALERSFGFESHKDNEANWKKGLQGIISLARSNRISADELKDHAKKSCTELFKHMPPKSENEPQRYLEDVLDQLKRALTLFDGSDTTATTLDYLKKLKNTINSLERGQIKYTNFATLISSKTAVKSKDHCEVVQGIAKTIESSAQFQNDLKEYIETQFEMASLAMKRYQDYKADRGLIDFIDQEERLFELLELEQVRERLSEDLDLLLVDEFQDTSPLQLAIFLKLSKLVKKTIWVGDPKQSIYAFRGADPASMTSMMDYLGGVKPEDIQDTSYRSTPELVSFSNDLFTKVFDFPEDQIILKAHRESLKGMKNSVEIWQTEKMTKDEYTTYDLKRALYGSSNSLIALSQKIHDYLNGHSDVLGGDVAVLLRKNDQCEEMAALLRELGYKVAIEGKGLGETPEVILLMNILTYLSNPYDELAKAIVAFIEDEVGLNDLVNDRLVWLSDSEEGEAWLAESKTISQLNELHASLGEPSVLETIDKVLLEFGLRQRVRRWGDEETREENLEMVRNLALSYENSCLNVGSGATLAGFLLWFNSQEKLPLSPGRGEEAINIMTYHKAKGLEWPVVFMGSMDNNAWVGHWSPMVIDESESFDPEDPLKDRWIRSWVNPTYKSKLPFVKEMETTQMHDDLMQKALKESSRLLYVGVTRARDKLVLMGEKFTWIDQILESRGHSFDPAEFNLRSVTMLPKEKGYDWTGELPKTHYHVIKESEGSSKERADLFVSPSSVEGDQSPFQGEDIDFADKQNIGLGSEVNLLGTALHNVLAVDGKLDEETILETLKAHQVVLNDVGEVGAIKARVEEFEKKLNELFPSFRWHREIPVRMFDKGQVVQGIVDLVLEGEEQLILIDHKSYQHESKSPSEKAGEFRPQLKKYAEILEKAFEKPVKKSFINFFLLGKIVEMGSDV